MFVTKRGDNIVFISKITEDCSFKYVSENHIRG